jgi:hypothetical protein
VKPYLVRGILLRAYPLAAFFGAVSFFPFGFHNPLERVGNRIGYLLVWTVIGVLWG